MRRLDLPNPIRLTAAVLALPWLPTSAAAQQASAPTPALAAASPCAHGPADDKAVMVTATVLVGRPRIRAVVDTALRGLGYAVSARETTPDQIVTEPRFTWPEGTESESWHGSASPGVQLVVDLEAAGDSTRVHVASSAVCALPADSAAPPPAKVESNLETMSAVQAATAIARALLPPAAPDSPTASRDSTARADSAKASAPPPKAKR